MSEVDPDDFENRFPDFKDQRLDEYCCYCGDQRSPKKTTLDHVPSAGLIGEPHPKDFPQVRVCIECNRAQSQDESYFYAILSAVLSGSHRYEDQILPVARRVLKSDKAIRKRVFAAKMPQHDGELLWDPDLETVGRVVTNYARGHLFLETGELRLFQPTKISIHPIAKLSDEDVAKFLDVSCDIFPELGSRLFLRMMEALQNGITDAATRIPNCFNTIKQDDYSYAVVFRNGTTEVRSLIKSYLATIVAWDH